MYGNSAANTLTGAGGKDVMRGLDRQALELRMVQDFVDLEREEMVDLRDTCIDHRLGVAGFDPCAILLNNDLSAGVPAILHGLEQTVLPPLHAGWAVRRKTQHFAAYEEVAKKFSKLLGMEVVLDPPHHVLADFAPGTFERRGIYGCQMCQVLAQRLPAGRPSRPRAGGVRVHPDPQGRRRDRDRMIRCASHDATFGGRADCQRRVHGKTDWPCSRRRSRSS